MRRVVSALRGVFGCEGMLARRVSRPPSGRGALLRCVLVLSVACGGDPLPPPGMDASFDGGRRDVGVRDAGSDVATDGASDASRDASSDSGFDGGTDATTDTGIDAAESDAGEADAASDAGEADAASDAAFDTSDSAISDFCAALVVNGISCLVDPCPDGMICVDDDCGGRHCLPSGRNCIDDTDCPAGGRCGSGLSSDYCVRPSGGCSDSRECPWGFSCEVGACVDRRVPCGEPSDPVCPPGFECFGDVLGFHPFCLKVTVRCEHDEVCLPGARCVDVDGDGRKECLPAGSCTTNVDCPTSGEVCGADATATATCGPTGPCSASDDCATGYECLDLWGDGVLECLPTAGLCVTNASCGRRQLCVSADGLVPPECL